LLCLLFNKTGEKGRPGSAWKQGEWKGGQGAGGREEKCSNNVYKYEYVNKKKTKYAEFLGLYLRKRARKCIQQT
jgi:hypothetical protein